MPDVWGDAGGRLPIPAVDLSKVKRRSTSTRQRSDRRTAWDDCRRHLRIPSLSRAARWEGDRYGVGLGVRVLHGQGLASFSTSGAGRGGPLPEEMIADNQNLRNTRSQWRHGSRLNNRRCTRLLYFPMVGHTLPNSGLPEYWTIAKPYHGLRRLITRHHRPLQSCFDAAPRESLGVRSLDVSTKNT